MDDPLGVLRHPLKVLKNIVATVRLARMLWLWQCDVVYTNTIMVCVGALAAKVLQRPHIWHIHEFGFEDHGLVFDFGSRCSLWLMDRLSAVWISNSQAVAAKFGRFSSRARLTTVYQSVTLRPNVDDDGEVIEADARLRCVIVGSLHKGKRQEDAIRAVAELVRMGVDARLVLVGGGNPGYRMYLMNLVRENALDDRVIFAGQVASPVPSLRWANVALQCSLCEAFGRAVIEAMLMGLPVVGANSGGTRELISDGFNGLLYTPGDYRELAEKLKYLYERPIVAQRMGEDGRHWARPRFTQGRYGEEILNVLSQVIDKNSNRRHV
jgi:glycosyltransferase involved in cell wall biosynthesis